jgi:NADH-quinone oxidoreductase subunit G
MPTVTIDGTEYEFEGDQKLLQFCLNQDIEIPHFCYHPAMSIPANCRQCLLKVGMPKKNRETGEIVTDDDGEPVIQFFPQMQASCTVGLQDGMVVKTQNSSEEVRRAQRDTLEFLLVNHPLDCPICDQAGHCPLQIQAYKYGPEGSRFEFRKVHKPKRVKLGPRVTLDAERCINCTRCTRFTDEVSGSGQLTINNRGVENYPITAPGEDFDEDYSMNTIDICPVGALTASDFRFKARIWEMSSTPSIVTTNATGANCDYWVRDNQVLRITPRQNMEVNEYWLPDEDRLVYDRFNEDRPESPQIRRGDALTNVGWTQAFAQASTLLGQADPERVLFLGSAYATVEDNYLLTQMAGALGADAPQYIPHIEPGAGDDWLITDDKTPNATGCERLDILPIDAEMLQARLADGDYDLVYLLEDDLVGSGVCSVDDLDGVDVILHHYNTTNETVPASDVALPAAMVVETVGTYVNQDGRAQRVRPAKEIQGVNRTLMMEMGKNREDEHGTPFDRWHNESNRVNCKPSWDLLPEIADRLSADVAFDYPKGPKAIMQEIQETLPAFEGATYEAMGLKGVQLEAVEAGETA